ncbi:hypothetical protein V6N12_073676 [Hibiscus sabdariffa]|uniref:YTH domain-containing family protein n=2 Tax=Hibiscus sabdariffa TaxID=183260 RepID=A0ABR2CT60_9ROSI
MGNSDDLGNEDGYSFRSQELEHSQVANKRGKLCNTRYFIIKSLNHQNIQLSIENGIWATQVMNEPILEEAFHNSGSVILVFSVNMSGFFQGYAQMISSVGWRRDNVWSQGSGKVKISRDCQELPQDIGEALCELLDVSNDVDVALKRDDLASKRPCLEPPYSLGDEDYNVSPLPMSWAESPLASTLTEDDFLEMTYEEYLEAHGKTSKQLGGPVPTPSQTVQESTSRKHRDELCII